MFDRLMNGALDFFRIISWLIGGGVAAWMFATGDGWNEKANGLAIGIISGYAAMLLFMAIFIFVALLHLWIWVPLEQAFADMKSILAAICISRRKP